MRNKPFLVIFLTVFLDLVGFGIIIPLSPYLARQYGADPLLVGLLMTTYSLFQFFFAPYWGQLSDRWGRRPVMLISLMGSVIAHLLFALSGNLLWLFIARSLAGLFGGNISAAMAAMADLTPTGERSKGMGLIGAAFGLGFILGPFLGGIFAGVGENLGSEPPWGGHFPALIASGLCLVNFLLAYFILPETHPKFAGKHVDLPERLPRLTQLRSALQRPGLGGLMGMYFFSSLAMAHMEASLFMLVQDRFAWSVTTASLGFAYVGVVMAITQGFLIRRTLPKWGEGLSMSVGLTLMALGFVGIALAPTPLWALTPVTLLALGNGFSSPALNGAVSLLAKDSEQGGTLGVNQSLSALGRIIGPATGGLAYREWGMSAPFWIATVLVLSAFAFWPMVGRHLPRGAKSA